MLKDVKHTYHPIVHALQEGHGRARISKIRNRGKGVPEEIIAGAMHVLKGHINVSPEDSDELVCPRFLPKKPSEEVVFEA